MTKQMKPKEKPEEKPQPIAFVGAGPGDADLITLKALKLLASAQLVIYAGSLVSDEVLQHADKNAQLIDSATLTLEEICDAMVKAYQSNKRVVRLHSGDLSLYSAVNEQTKILKQHAVPYLLVPGVPAFAAASAAMQLEFTVPEISQSIILTRYPGRASTMPQADILLNHVRSNATVVVHLAITALAKIVRELTPVMGKDAKVAVAYRIGWQDEQIIYATLDTIRSKVKAAKITRQAMIILSPALAGAHTRSKLYNASHKHLFREASKDEKAN